MLLNKFSDTLNLFLSSNYTNMYTITINIDLVNSTVVSMVCTYKSVYILFISSGQDIGYSLGLLTLYISIHTTSSDLLDTRLLAEQV